jgi:glycosyltransferase involved in cell wall biosynthesis
VNHEVFRAKPHLSKSPDEINVVSYSGRSLALKGFREMAEAVKIVRQKLANYRVNWLVFGTEGELRPNNSVAPYVDFGFLKPEDLAKLYQAGDVFLSASWYESFPLFPLEAMACGLPVVTTPFGTEDYALAGETAEVVEARNPTSIANGLIRLITDVNYRNRIAKAGNEISRQFTWEKSVATMESLLLDGA